MYCFKIFLWSRVFFSYFRSAISFQNNHFLNTALEIYALIGWRLLGVSTPISSFHLLPLRAIWTLLFFNCKLNQDRFILATCLQQQPQQCYFCLMALVICPGTTFFCLAFANDRGVEQKGLKSKPHISDFQITLYILHVLIIIAYYFI